VYDNLDWLVYRALDQRFDIRDAQRPWVKERLRVLHHWHRETQLPGYGETLRELARRFADGFDLNDFGWIDRRIEAHRSALVAKVIPDFAQFLAGLDAAQIDHFVDFSAESLEEAAEPLAMGVEERVDHRVEQFTEQLTPWTGALTRTQAAALRRELAIWPDFRRDWIEQRQIRQQTLVALLRSDPGVSAIEDYLTAQWLDLGAGYPQQYWERRQAAKGRLFRVLWDLEQRLTTQQRRHFLERLQGYADDIRRLTRQRA
jgi:hypothetical protein